jgi:hypothetical protein
MNRKSAQDAHKRRTATPRVPITLRLPKTIVARIEEDLGHRDVPLSRNNWFLEAVIEKLRRGGTGDTNGAK